MKIKIWAFVLIVVGAVLLGGLGGFALSQGFSLAGSIVSELRAGRIAEAPKAQFQVPADPPSGGNGQGRVMPGFSWGNGQDALPPGFNAGVSIPGTYADMTGRTEEQVLAAAKEANTDTWGLAAKESKLDQLKQKVLEAVTVSLDKMVADGKITKVQKDAYLQRVNMILQIAGQPDANSGATVAPTDKPAA